MPQSDGYSSIPACYQEKAKAMASAFQALDQVIISAHVNPDGDALGSVCAGALLLKALGKECVLYSSTGVPDFLSFFPLPAPLVTSLSRLPFSPRSALLVDCGEFHRIGGDLEAFAPDLPRVNIDHHRGNGMGSLATWVAPEAAATAQLMAYIALALGVPLEGELGCAVALGVITDTGGFAYANTSAEVFDLCALLVRGGCNIARLREEIDGNTRVERMHLWARLVEKVTFSANGCVAFCTASQEDLSAVSARREDLEGFVEYLRRLKGVKVSALVREDEAERCKYSLRSVPDVDVCSLAQSMQGGGHRNAAGGTLTLSLAEASQKLQEGLETLTF